MSLFNSHKISHTPIFSLGKPEAEAELTHSAASPAYENLFLDEIGVLAAINNGRFIITGRKGSGKSAIVNYIKIHTNLKNGTIHSTKIEPFDQISKRISSTEDLNGDRILYDWVIISNLIKMIINTKLGEYTKEIQALNKFYSKYDVLFDLENFLRQSTVVNLSMSINLLLGVFGTSFTRERSRRENENRPFYTFIPGLYDVIKRVLNMPAFSDNEFIVMFDDLDINFNLKNNNDRDKILDLIRAAKAINTSTDFSNKVHILLFLRDDVRRNLSGHASDCNKIFDSYSFTLDWYDEGRDKPDNKLKLKAIVNRRLEENFKLRHIKYNQFDPWCSYVQEANHRGTSSIFRKLLDFTFFRPRDLINLFLPLENNSNFQLPLEYASLKSLLKIFSEKIYGEFEDEIAIFASKDIQAAIKELLANIVRQTKNSADGLTYNQLLTMITKPLDVSIINILYEYDVLGFIDNIGDSHFHFRHSFPSVPLEQCRFCVPNIIKLYFDRSTPIYL